MKLCETIILFINNGAQCSAKEMKDKDTGGKCTPIAFTLFYGSPTAPPNDITDFLSLVTVAILQTIHDMKSFSRPATSMDQRLVLNTGLFALMLAEVLAATPWVAWHDRILTLLLKILKQSVGVNGVKSSYAEAGGAAVARGIGHMYEATNSLVLKKFSQTFVSGIQLASVVSDVVADRMIILGPANQDTNFVPCLLRSLLRVVERAAVLAAQAGPELTHMIVVLFREIHATRPQLMSSLGADYGTAPYATNTMPL